jgi:hypothetical protein
VVIKNNTVFGSSRGSGIVVNGDRIQIIGNVVKAASLYGIRIRSKSTQTYLANNFVSLTDGTSLTVDCDESEVSYGMNMFEATPASSVWQSQGLKPMCVGATNQRTIYPKSHHHVFCSTGVVAASYKVNLPKLADTGRAEFYIYKTVAASTVMVTANAADTIEGSATLGLYSQYDNCHLQGYGTTWYRVD